LRRRRPCSFWCEGCAKAKRKRSFAGGHAERWRGEARRRSGPTPIFTMWMVEKLDKEAKRLVTTGQSVIKMRLTERLDRPPADRAANPLH